MNSYTHLALYFLGRIRSERQKQVLKTLASSRLEIDLITSVQRASTRPCEL